MELRQFVTFVICVTILGLDNTIQDNLYYYVSYLNYLSYVI